jgi:hypothetical protein
MYHYLIKLMNFIFVTVMLYTAQTTSHFLEHIAPNRCLGPENPGRIILGLDGEEPGIV